MQGVCYAQFLIPGLIMLQVIDSSYGECSSSLFQGRFMNSIQELLIAPMSAVEIVGGYILGSLRASLSDRRVSSRCWASFWSTRRRTIGRSYLRGDLLSSRCCSRRSD